MQKRGEVESDIIKYFTIAIIIILITLFGYGAYAKIRERLCKIEMTGFENELGDVENSVSYGSVMDFANTPMPCSADKIYFFDLDKEAPLSVFEDLPVVRESLKEKVQKNVFLVKDDEVITSFYSANFEFMYPYYSCLESKYGEISFFLESHGKKVRLIPGCSQPDCTLIPVNISEERAREILQEFKDFGCEGCPANMEYEIGNFRETIKKMNIYRRITYCKDTGITKVTIIIKPKEKVEDFYFYEFIPKECVNELEQYLEGIDGGDFYINKSDPLIMWHFNEVEDEEEAYYSLRKELSEDCKKLIEGMGIAKLLDISQFNSAPSIMSSAPIDAMVGFSYSYQVEATDADGDALTYSLDTAPSGMTINNGLISWTPFSSGSYNVMVAVSDGISTDSQEFIIDVGGSCTPVYYNDCDNSDGCGLTRPTSPYNSCDLSSDMQCGTETECLDGFDNDCDGATDSLDSNCVSCADNDGDNRGAGCALGLDCNDANLYIYSGNSNNYCDCDSSDGYATGTTEICDDGQDNDCNGLKDCDESICNGQSCGSGMVCSGASCVAACNDNDNDGYYANSVQCPTGNDCDDADNLVNPGTTEVCGNGIDDNCDTQKNEGCEGVCDTDGDGHDEDGIIFVWCSILTGHPSDDCDDDDASIYEGADELCDNKDNDCDLSFDEDFTNKGQVCSVGIGACEASGTYVCKSDGSGTKCNAIEGSSQTETCDNLDNNCDGSLNENLIHAGPPNTKQSGVCYESKKSCDASHTSWFEDYSGIAGYETTETICSDVKDNDCDGLPDCSDSNCDGQTCDTGKVCSSGSCVASCADECSPSGDTRCRDSYHLQTCGNYDADTCLEWGNEISCSGGCVSNTCFIMM